MNALEFDRLVQKYQSLVYTICRQLVADEGYAQDLTQETFLSAWRSMDRCPAGYEKQWLARIASNKAKDYLRSEPRLEIVTRNWFNVNQFLVTISKGACT